MTPKTDSVAVLRAAICALEYAAFNLDGSKLADLPPGIVDSTGASTTALIAARDLRAHVAALSAQGEAVAEVRENPDDHGTYVAEIGVSPLPVGTKLYLHLHPAPPGADAVTARWNFMDTHVTKCQKRSREGWWLIETDHHWTEQPTLAEAIDHLAALAARTGKGEANV